MRLQIFWTGLTLGLLVAGCGGGDHNQPPVASGGSLNVDEDGTASFTAVVSDPENDALTVTVVVPPTQGTVTVSPAPPFVFAYTPASNKNGTDGFDFRVSDSHGGTATASVSIIIARQPDPPVVAAQTFAVDEDSSLDGRIVSSDPDGDAVTLQVTVAPTHGTLAISDAKAGTFQYTPAHDFNGTDSFTVGGSDGSFAPVTGVMTVTVKAVNDAPVAADDTYVVPKTGTSTLNVLANDTDVDGDALTIEIAEAPPGATATVQNGAIQLTPLPGVAGPTRLTYRARDPAGAAATATARVVMGSATPIFFSSDAKIYRYDGLARMAIDTPVPNGEALESFTTSANGTRMIYVSRTAGGTYPYHLYLKDLINVAAASVQLVTDPSFFPYTVAISADGKHAVVNGDYRSLTNLALIQSLASGAERAMFTSDSQSIVYPVLVSGGGRVIMKSGVSPAGGLAGTLQITKTYGTAEGLGIDFGLSPDETLVTSQALRIVGVRPPDAYAYVTPLDGSQNDMLLHPAFTTNVDYAHKPFVTRDDRYAYFMATLSGVDGIYATDLQAPGTAVRIDSAPNGFYVPLSGILADMRTVLYSQMQVNTLGPAATYTARIDQPGSATAFAPSGAGTPGAAAVSPDGSTVTFFSGSDLFVSKSDQLTSATRLLQGSTSGNLTGLVSAPDSSALAVRKFDDQTGPAHLILVNPKIPGWSEDLGRSTEMRTGVTCVVFAGSRC